MMPRTGASSVDEEPLISKLPTDVLISILEKVDLRDAVRAGVLSRRWRRLPHQLPRIVLDMDDFWSDEQECYEEDDGVDDPDGGDDDEDQPDEVAPDHGPHVDVLSEAGDKMLHAATALLNCRDKLPVCAVRMYLRHNYMSLGRLLDDAITGGKVSAAELTITTMFEEEVHEDGKSAIRSLVGYGRRFRKLFDGCAAFGGRLTRLTMEKMRLGRPDLRDILTACGGLETLYLYHCDPGPRGIWKVRHSRLEDVTIEDCCFHGVNLAWLPRLKRLTFRTWHSKSHEPLSFGHVPCLTTLTMSNYQSAGQEILKLSHTLANTAIRDLRLNFAAGDIWVEPEAPKPLTNIFRNLKYLKLRNVHEECGLNWTLFLLQAAPLLKDLYIKLLDHECNVQSVKMTVPREVATSLKHNNLARLTILGFYSTEEIIVTYMRRLVEVAVNLEEIYIRQNAAATCEVCGPIYRQVGSRFPRTDEDRESLVERIIDRRSIMSIKIIIQSKMDVVTM